MKKVFLFSLIFSIVFLASPVFNTKASVALILSEPSDYLINDDSSVTVYLVTNLLAGECYLEYGTEKTLKYGTSSVEAVFDSSSSGNYKFKAELTGLDSANGYFYKGVCESGDSIRRSATHVLYKNNYVSGLSINIDDDLVVDSGLNTKVYWSVSGLVDECNMSYAKGVTSPMSGQVTGIFNEEADKYSASLVGLSKDSIYKYQVYCVFKSGLKESETKTFTAIVNKKPDLKIENVYFSTTPSKENYFDGSLNVSVNNIGKDDTKYGGGVKISAKMYKEDGSLIVWNTASSSGYMENIKTKSSGYISLPIEKYIFNTDLVKVKVWVDNAENGTGYIDEINEENNSYEKEFIIGENADSGLGNIQEIGASPIIDPLAGNFDPIIDPILSPVTDPAIVAESDLSVAPSNTGTTVDDLYSYEQKAKFIYEGSLGQILENIGDKESDSRETENRNKYLLSLKEDFNLTSDAENAINNFITYGSDNNTKGLGAGERAAVIFSFKEAFKKLPTTEEDLTDVVKIANGRWPTQKNAEAERRAKDQFIKIYKKIVDMDNPKDDAAITVMAYGLRQKSKNRNLDSERNGINIFKGIYGYTPKTTNDWNIMQAITYSGALRSNDSDGDLLIDERERALGTDSNNPDTDGDGYLDGVEVDHGYDPLN